MWALDPALYLSSLVALLPGDTTKGLLLHIHTDDRQLCVFLSAYILYTKKNLNANLRKTLSSKSMARGLLALGRETTSSTSSSAVGTRRVAAAVFAALVFLASLVQGGWSVISQ